MLFGKAAFCVLASAHGLFAAPADSPKAGDSKGQPSKQTAPVNINKFTSDEFKKDFTATDGTWTVGSDGVLKGVDGVNGVVTGPKAVSKYAFNRDTFKEYTITATIAVDTSPDPNPNAGIIFAVRSAAIGIDNYMGYFCGFNAKSQSIVLGMADGKWHPLQTSDGIAGLPAGQPLEFLVKVFRDGSIRCEVGGHAIVVPEPSGGSPLTNGMVGLRTLGTTMHVSKFKLSGNQ